MVTFCFCETGPLVAIITLVHTGQNYDYELNEIFFSDLELRKPDHFLEVDKSSLGAAVGDIFRKSETVLKDVKPDAFLVLGDTNSCLAAYMSKRLKVPVFHMEAGNSCFDFNVPEELSLKEKEYFLASFHREENVDNPENLEDLGIKSSDKGIHYLKPFGFTDYVHLQTRARCTTRCRNHHPHRL